MKIVMIDNKYFSFCSRQSMKKNRDFCGHDPNFFHSDLFFYNIKTGLAEWKHVQVRISPQKSLVNGGFAEHYWSANVVGTHGVSNHYTSLIPDRKPVGSM